MALITAIRYLGHSATMIEAADLRLAIDPWLEGNPRCPSHLRNPERLDIIVLTHAHSDHAGDAVRLAKKLGSKIVAIFELAQILSSQGIPEEQLIPMNKGGTVSLLGLSVSLTNAFHSSSYTTPRGQVYAGEACGAVVRGDNVGVYHTGDTCLFSDMKLIGELYHPEISLIPVGDHFTMGPKEAAMAASFVKCRVAIPMHYKTFGVLTGTAEEFSRECQSREVAVQILEPGQSFDVRNLH